MIGVRKSHVVLLGLLLQAATVASASNLIRNGDFEALPGSAGFGWVLDPTLNFKGSLVASSTSSYSGQYSLKLVPETGNIVYDRDQGAFGVGQAISASGLSGESVTMSAVMKADSGSEAVVREYQLKADGSVTLQAFRQGPSDEWIQHRDVINVDPATTYLIITCEVIGTSGAAYFDALSLTPGVPTGWLEANGAKDPLTNPLQANVQVNAGEVIRTIPPTVYGTNLEWIWDGDGAWNASTEAPTSSVLSLTQVAGPTLFRFPGGVFSDFYDWRNGVGAISSRPLSLSMPGGSVSANDFGTEEALAFAKRAGGQLLITVNVVTGTPQDAADWVRYVNNGSRRVDYWELGNESYVNGNDAYVAAATLTPEQYANRVLAFAQAMRAVDPMIKIGAIADENFSAAAPQSYTDWTARVLAIAGHAIDFVSVHTGYAPGIAFDNGLKTRTVYSALLAAPTLIAARLDDLARRIDAAVPDRAGKIQIAVTEWGPYFQSSPSGRFVDHTKTLASALFAASTLKVFVESSRVIVANAFKLVDSAYQGWIGQRQGLYLAKPNLLALEMFTRHFGTELVHSTTSVATFDTPSIGWVDATRAPFLDVVCSTSATGDTLFILAINKNLDRSVTAQIALDGFAPASTATAYTLSGAQADSNTGTQLPSVPGIVWAAPALLDPVSEFTSGTPSVVTIRASQVVAGSAFSYAFPPHSITSLVLSRQP